MAKRRRSRFAIAAATFVGSILLALFVEYPHGPGHWTGDLVTKYFSKTSAGPSDDVVIVEISPKTLATMPYLSPIDRGFLANLIKTIAEAKPKVIGLDILIDRPTEPHKDKLLADTLARIDTPLVLAVASDEDLSAEDQRFRAKFLADAAKRTGHIYFGDAHGNPALISDSVVRKFVALNHTGMGLGLAQTMVLEANRPIKSREGYIAWTRPAKDPDSAFSIVAAQSIVGDKAQSMSLITEMLKDKFVLVGGVFPDVDQHLTPLSVLGSRSPGVVIHAYILQQMLDGPTLLALDEMPWLLAWLAAAAVVGFGLSAIALLARHEKKTEFVIAFVLVISGVVLFSGFDVVVPFAGVMIVFIAAFAAGHVMFGHEQESGSEIWP